MDSDRQYNGNDNRPQELRELGDGMDSVGSGLPISRLPSIDLSDSPRGPESRTQHYSELKWHALQKSYEDGYAELLRNDLTRGHNDGALLENLEQSQLGAVTWYPYEKEALYQALSRKGQRELPFLAEAVGSKSQLEVQDYLLLLREKESERHLFYRQTKTISHADIPAAVEISSTVEEALEQAANAQLAYEEYYFYVTDVQKRDGLWIIDSQVAEKLDADHDKAEDALLESGETSNESTFETPIFHISTFIELSERLFMNCGDSSNHGNWRKVAMEGETPAMTQEVVSELYDLVVNFSRKLIQTSLFLAQSRQRATTNSHYRHRAIVREQDVATAIKVLDLKCDLWDFWVGVPRRNKLDIVDDRGRKGYGRKRLMPCKAVEQILSKRISRWRGRRRSTSMGTDTSLTEDDAFDTVDQMDEGISGAHDPDSSSSARSQSLSSEESTHEQEAHPLDAVLDADALEFSPGDVSSDSSDTGSSGSDGFDDLSFHSTTPSQKDRQLYLEKRQDEYLTQIDAEASREEETRLLQIFGREAPKLSKPEDDKNIEMMVRPKVLRKSIDNLKDPLLSHKYGAEWELFGAVVPNKCFAEIERARKRPRTATDEGATNPVSRNRGKRRELPIRTPIRLTRRAHSTSRETPQTMSCNP